MPRCLSDAVTASWAAPLDELFAERMPDALKQFRVVRCLAHFHRIARSGKVHFERILDLAGTRREQDDAVGECQRLAKIVRYEQDGLLFAFPNPQQYFMHVDFGVGIECTE